MASVSYFQFDYNMKKHTYSHNHEYVEYTQKMHLNTPFALKVVF